MRALFLIFFMAGPAGAQTLRAPAVLPSIGVPVVPLVVPGALAPAPRLDFSLKPTLVLPTAAMPLPQVQAVAAPKAEPLPVMAALSDAAEAVAKDAQAGRSPDASLSAAFDLSAPKRGGAAVDLSETGTADTGGLAKTEGLRRTAKDAEKLDELQQRLYADGKRSVLIILQGMDTSGKDGTIRHVFSAMTPQGVEVHSFKKPTPEEAKHGFLWRIRKALPGKGKIGVFNRSHYEDILVPTVYETLPVEEIEKRYGSINAFEKKLSERGVVVLKFFLHISKDEQKERLQERLDDPDKRWKFSPEDLKSREHWDELQAAYEKVLERTSTPWAPWHIIPADKKWYRNYLVGRILRETLEKMALRYPQPDFDPKKIKIPD